MKIYINARDKDIQEDEYDRLYDRYFRETAIEDIEYIDSIVLEVDTQIEVAQRGEWEDLNDYNWAYPSDDEDTWYNEDDVALDDGDMVIDKVAKLLTPHLPYRPGKYDVHFVAILSYIVDDITQYSDGTIDYSNADSRYSYKDSQIKDVIISRV